MSILVNRPAAASKPRKQRFFQIVFEIEGDAYKVSVLPCDPGVGKKAFRFRKLTATGPTTYDVRFTEHGPECDCMGYLRHGRCKHAETLQAAEQVFRIPA
jgi:hypothetical protein